YPQINWGSKSDSLSVIKESLNIGYDSIFFIDDEPFEGEEVAFIHPEIQCFSPEQITTLLRTDVFQARIVTSETSQRRLMYQLDEKRNQVEQRFSNNIDFLRSLDMCFRISKASIEDLQRVEELTVRTHQLNSTGYTYSYDTLA